MPATIKNHKDSRNEVESLLNEVSQQGIHLYVDEQKLKFKSRVGGLSASLKQALSDNKADIIAYLSQRQKSAKKTLPAIIARKEGKARLSYSQQRMWFLNQFIGDNAVYNSQLALRISSDLVQQALTQAVQEIFNRHETLRTRFESHGDEILQVVEEVDIVLPLETVSGLDAVYAISREEKHYPFSLSKDQLCRMRLLKDSDSDNFYLLITLHHSISDGWSTGVLVKEIGALYAAYKKGDTSPLSALPIQYADYANWQRDCMEGEFFHEQLNYWRDQLSGMPAKLELPTDRPRPVEQSYNGDIKRIQLSNSLTAKVLKFVREQNVTLYMTLMSAFSVLLSRYSGQKDIALGTPIANRTRQETEQLIGFFANTLVMRCDLNGDPNFQELVQKTRDMALEAYQYQDIPFEQLVEELNPIRDLSYSPLFQVMFTVRNVPDHTRVLQEQGFAVLPPQNSTQSVSEEGEEQGVSHFDLTFNLTETPEGIKGVLEYNTDLFDASTIEDLLMQYQRLLIDLLASPQVPISRIRRTLTQQIDLSALPENSPLTQLQMKLGVTEQTDLVLLDEFFQPVMSGAVGELYISFTKDALIPDELSAALTVLELEVPGYENTSRWIKTGELARLNRAGKLVFSDVDEQVQKRVVFAKMQELKHLLLAHPDISEAFITDASVFSANNDAAHQILAYVESDKAQGDRPFAAVVKKYIRKQPKQFLLPAAVVVLDKLPLNSRGQVNTQALPVAEELKALKPAYIAPRDDTESHLCDIWQDLLKVEKVGVMDNFFALGGHSLLATRLINAIRDQLDVELPLKTLFKMPTVAAIAECLSECQSADSDTLIQVKADKDSWYQPFPLTPIQQAYLLGRSSAFELGNIATHAYGEMTMTDLSVERFTTALNCLIQRHGMLRAIFDTDAMTQRILENVPEYDVKYLDLSKLSEQDREEKLMAIREKMSHQVLAHDTWPLFEMRVTRVSDQDYRLHYSRDALISDAASQKIFRTELFQLYENPDLQLQDFDISFRDYVLTEEAIRQSPIFDSAKDYWHNRLEEFPMAPELPLAKKPNQITQPQFGTYLHRIDNKGWARFKIASQSLGVTPTVLIMTLFSQILNRWSKHPRFTLNLTLFNRLPLHEQVNHIFGDFTSLTLLAVNNQKGDTIQTAARRLQEQLWTDLEHRYFGGTDMLRALNARAGAAQAVAMPIVFTSTLGLEQEESNKKKVKAEAKRKSGFSVSQTPQVWLDHGVVTTEQGLVLKWSVLEELFPVGMIDQMFEAYVQLMDYVADGNADMGLTYLEFLAKANKTQILYPAVAPLPLVHQPELMHELFVHQALRTPDAIAIVDGKNRVTYKQLHQYAQKIAQHLRSHKVRPNQLVSVVMEKGWEQVAAVLGVQYAGAAYLPIDATIPDDRIAMLVSNALSQNVLTQQHLIDGLAFLSRDQLNIFDVSTIKISATEDVSFELESVQSASDLAYVIFTSGSTGKPKGVMIDHRGAMNTILDINEKFNVTAQDSVLAVSNLNFDLSVYDIFGLLAVGGALVIPERGREKEPKHWLELVLQESITIWNTVPALAELFIEEVESQGRESVQSLADSGHAPRLFMLSGDWINLDLPDRLKSGAPGCEVISLGGATEASVWSIYHPIEKVKSHWKSIPYGKPMKNQEVYILDENLAEKPIWATGSIYIGGLGVAKGYWQDAERTADSFIKHPITQAYLYKTGDLGRYWPNGNIEFLGRNDNQVKIHGHRIELGEVESALTSHSKVKESIAVVLGEGKSRHLAAYIVPNNEAGNDSTGRGRNDNARDEKAIENSLFKLEQKGLLDINDYPNKITFASKSRNEALTAYQFADSAEYAKTVSALEKTSSIEFYQLGEWLAALRQLHFEASQYPLPKRFYPSAGSLYPIQVYLSVQKDTVKGEQLTGVYYYDPATHQLVQVSETPTSGTHLKEHPLSLYIVAQKDAIEPLYGDLTERFCLLEAGHINQLLESTSLLHSLALEPFSDSSQANISEDLHLTNAQKVLFSRAVSCVAAEQIMTTHKADFSVLERQSYREFSSGDLSRDTVTALLTELGHIPCSLGLQFTNTNGTQDFYFYQSESQSLKAISNEVSVTEQLHGGANQNIYRSSTVTIYLMADAANIDEQLWLKSGYLGQILMSVCTKHQLGFCPIGNMNFAPVSKALNLGENTQLIYAFVGGAITREQMTSWAIEPVKDAPAELIDEQELKQYLTSILPYYMLPNQFKQLTYLPLTANGKIDRKSLPEFDSTQVQNTADESPQGMVEELLESMWCGLLGKDNIGRHESFFTLGGHSLLAIQLASRVRDAFDVDLPMRVFFELQTIQQQAQAIDQLGSSDNKNLVPIAAVDHSQPQHLSYAQRRLWFIDQLGSGSAEYNMMGTYILPGELDVQAFKKAFDSLIQRHKIVRTRFISVNGEPKQVIYSDYDLPLVQDDISDYSEVEKARMISKIAAEEVKQPFDLSKDVLLRIRLIKLSNNINLVMYVTHHVASDIWSLGVFKREMHSLYQAFCLGEDNPLAPLPAQYIDFAQWQIGWLSEEVLEKQLSYWQQQLADLPSVHNLPLDYVRPAQQVFEGQRHQHNLDTDLTQKINRLCREHQVTQFMFLETAFTVLLSRYSNEADIVIGSAISGRNHQDVENLIGFFVNTLVLRTDLSGDPCFSMLLDRNKRMILDAYAHQNIPFEMLVEKMRPTRNLSYNPLYQVMFAMQKREPVLQNKTSDTELSDAEKEAMKRIQQSLSMKSSTRFDLLVHIAEQQDSLTVNWLYNEALFHQSSIARLGHYYTSLLNSIVDELLSIADGNQAQESTISQLNILTDNDRQALFTTSHGETVAEWDISLHERFEQQAEITPSNIAVRLGRDKLTYQELNEKANSLAQYLIKQKVTRNQLVAVCVEDSVELMVGLLAVLKTGAAYLPMAPDLPSARFAYMLDNANVQIVLTLEHLTTELNTGDRKVLALDSDLMELICRQFAADNITRETTGHQQDDLAYVIYTSGTTGQAKGVMVSHQAAMAYCRYGAQNYYQSQLNGSLIVTSFSVDMSLPSLFLPLFNGDKVQMLCGSVVLDKLSIHLQDSEENYLLRMTPSHAQGLTSLLPEGTQLSNQHIFVIGGEALSGSTVSQIKQVFPNATFYNHYGPTEGVVGCTINTQVDDEAQGIVPIGTAMDNVKLYVLDNQQKLHLPGSVGELAIGGHGIAEGYLNDDSYTKEKFIIDPFTTGADDPASAKLYLTGDLVRWLPDNQLMYIGRSDEQIKVRGIRIELGEIESSLKRTDGICDAVLMVASIEGSNEYIVAWIVPEFGIEAEDELELQQEKARLIKGYREALTQYLPDHMIPSVFVFLDKIPLTANGKVDKKSLPAPQGSDLHSEIFVAPETKTEEKLCELWQEVLQLERIGIQDNFFVLGGHSLIATQLVSRIREVFSVELPVRLMFEQQTVRELAQEIESTVTDETRQLPVIEVVSREQPLPLSHAQQRLWFLNRYMGANAVYNIPLSFRLCGEIKEAVLCQSLNEIVKRHETLRTRFIEIDGSPLQVIDNTVADISIESVSNEQVIQQVRIEERQHRFDLANDALSRIRVLKNQEDNNYVLLITLHHSVSDRWSLGILFKEFATLYQAFSQQDASPLPKLVIQYGDYAHWQRRTIDDSALKDQLDYWRDQLSGLPPLLLLPTDKPRPKKQQHRGKRRSVILPESLSKEVLALSNAQGVTLFMTLISAFSVLLSRYSGQTDIAIGTPVANRNRKETEALIGFFVNTLVMRCDLQQDPSFLELLHHTKETALQGYANQDIPFEQLVEKLNPDRKLNHSPLFQVMFALQNVPVNSKALEGIEIDYLENETEDENVGSHFDLTLSLREVDGIIRGGIEYDIDLFESDTIDTMLVHYENLLAAIVSKPSQSVSRLALLNDSVQTQQVELWHQYYAQPKALQLLTSQLKRVEFSAKDFDAKLYLLDQYSNIVPCGAVGEVFVPASTTATQTLNWLSPQYEEIQLQATGLLARNQSGGELVFSDSDWNVKTKEFESELLDLCTLLQEHVSVKDATVIAMSEGEEGTKVIAFIVPTDTEADNSKLTSQLKKFIRSQPHIYLLPAAIYQLEDLPKNSRGQLDRGSLLTFITEDGKRKVYIAPRNETEQALCGYWQDMLGHDKVGIDDNFFALGGHSLITTKLLNRIREELFVSLSLQTLFEYPTVREVAQRIKLHKEAQQLNLEKQKLFSNNEEIEEGTF